MLAISTEVPGETLKTVEQSSCSTPLQRANDYYYAVESSNSVLWWDSPHGLRDVACLFAFSWENLTTNFSLLLRSW